MKVETTKTEVLYTYLDETATFLEEHWTVTYLEGIAEAGENLFTGEICQTVLEKEQLWLQERLEKIKAVEFTQEEVRKAFQLAVLKGMKGVVQPHHSMTPDAVCLFISYLVNKVIGKNKQDVSLLDMAVGSGNLLSALANQTTCPLQAYGFEVDETLLKLAFVSANLQKHEIQLFHKDSVEPLALPEVDLVVTDLPVGYYPKDDVAQSYTLKSEEGHSFIHHLMIEQAIAKTKAGGYLFFVVPNFLFESEQAKQLHDFIKKEANILGLLQLPKTMFQSQQAGKSIFMLQKKGDKVIVPKQALLAELPSFKNKEALADMIKQINKWFEKELRIL
ncbi:class I SAM-dependent methyltransferase [Halalkalibacter akibai]|uniref:Adenine-specific methyltransferase n=1 Tax=Halalkalibacter akibai (strain ATCC 43226 / DSM 21942 / CIP 109018 / JCM 9157 / 1139) TaxID=1236973 RepID=W4QR67_HALA3|nr:class I SAM-dependent methyltransferase [Halalkalibacter akibai]GAE34143.1 adenine-specific methyltransferase [Halalkalibacter akibai JCM 9157]